MLDIPALNALAELSSRDTSFEVTFRGTKIKMALISGAEAAHVRHHFKDMPHEDITPYENAVETVLFALRALNDVEFNAVEMSDEDRDKARQMLMSLPSIIISFFHQTYLQHELEEDAAVGVSQLRHLLLTNVLRQIAGLIDFPIILADLINAIVEKETPQDIATEMLKLKDRFIPAPLPEPTPTPPPVDPTKPPESEKPTEYMGRPIDDAQITGAEPKPIATITEEISTNEPPLPKPVSASPPRSEAELAAMRSRASRDMAASAEQKLMRELQQRPKK